MSRTAERTEKHRARARTAGTSAPPALDVSVVVTIVERPAPVVGFYREYAEALRKADLEFEFLFVLEPWARKHRQALEELAREGAPIRVLDAPERAGEAGQLKIAARACRANVVVTLPAYRRVDASCIPRLVERLEQSADLVVARRWPRKDAWLNRLQNRGFHVLARAATSRPLHDIACGVRAMRRELLGELPLYGDSTRFLPLFALQEGFVVDEIDCAQHVEDARIRVYPLGTYVRRMLDLFGVFFLLRFTYRPLRFFGPLGAGLSAVGSVVLVILLIQRLLGQGIANRPLLLLGVLLVTLGFQVVALGLVGELIVHLHAQSRPYYRVRETA